MGSVCKFCNYNLVWFKKLTEKKSIRLNSFDILPMLISLSSLYFKLKGNRFFGKIVDIFMGYQQ